MSDQAILQAILRLERAVVALSDRVDQVVVSRRSGLSRDDVARLSRLLPGIAGALGSDPVLASEILEHDAPGLRIVCEGLNARQLGRLLKRATGTAIAGYAVERVAEEAGAVVWRIVATA